MNSVLSLFEISSCRPNLRDRLRGNTDLKTPSALLGTSALAASIVLEHGGAKEKKKKRWKSKKRDRGNSYNLEFSRSSGKDQGRRRSLSEGSVTPQQYYSSEKRSRAKTRSLSTDGSLDLKWNGEGVRTTSGDAREVVLTDIITRNNHHNNNSKGEERNHTLSYINEGFVRDLPPHTLHTDKMAVLGDLITQVIIEETSSDVENERVL